MTAKFHHHLISPFDTCMRGTGPMPRTALSHTLRLTAFALLLALKSVVWASFACAADYPTRPVKIIVQTPAGTAPDVICRLLAEQSAKLWRHCGSALSGTNNDTAQHVPRDGKRRSGAQGPAVGVSCADIPPSDRMSPSRAASSFTLCCSPNRRMSAVAAVVSINPGAIVFTCPRTPKDRLRTEARWASHDLQSRDLRAR
jgi:hypothetical protein